MTSDLKFPVLGQNLFNFLHKRTDLFQRFFPPNDGTLNDFQTNTVTQNDFINFCHEVIENEAEIVQWREHPYSYYDGIDVCTYNVCEYQGIFYVIPGPEHDRLGYFFTLEAAVDAAEVHIGEVYDEAAYQEYYAQQKANGEKPLDTWNY